MAVMELNKALFDQLRSADKPLLVDFWAPWCGFCRKIEPAYEKIAAQYGEELVVAKVHVDKEPRLAGAEQIEVIPTLVLYRNGEALGSIVAPDSGAMIEQFIRETLAGGA